VSWTPDPAGFGRDLEMKPAALRTLADGLTDDPWAGVRNRVRGVVLLGMGSSRFAARPVAARLRANGTDAVAEYASAGFAHQGGPGTLAIGVSASGTTAETVDAITRHRGAGSTTVAITNTVGSPLETVADHHLSMRAGDEIGGVACRSYQHTLALLLALLDLDRAVAAIRRAADATEDLLARRDVWLPPAVELAAATGTAFLIAPAARIGSAEQGALMLREGPRMQADACEAGDWLHVDVYLTKPLDYRAIVFAESPYDAPIMEWMRERDGRVLAVGADVADAAQVVRYARDDDPDVALLTEVLVPELISATVWAAQA
jgi:glucosamine--fructose-6-phosphate aminotransferase (isomerizing)